MPRLPFLAVFALLIAAPGALAQRYLLTATGTVDETDWPAEFPLGETFTYEFFYLLPQADNEPTPTEFEYLGTNFRVQVNDFVATTPSGPIDIRIAGGSSGSNETFQTFPGGPYSVSGSPSDPSNIQEYGFRLFTFNDGVIDGSLPTEDLDLSDYDIAEAFLGFFSTARGGNVNVRASITEVTVTVATNCVADLDLDYDVDLSDFGIFGAAFGSSEGDSNYNALCDFDGDGDVDLTDFGVFGSEFGGGNAECQPGAGG